MIQTNNINKNTSYLMSSAITMCDAYLLYIWQTRVIKQVCHRSSVGTSVAVTSKDFV